MPKENLIELREQFLKGNNVKLKELYKKYRDDVITVTLAKSNVDPLEVESHFNQALIIFYENVVSGKLEELTSIKNYLIGICININRREITYKSKLSEKVEEVRLLLYGENDNMKGDEDTMRLKGIAMNAIKNLTEQCQQIIISYYIDKLTMKEIATYLKLSSGDVAKTLKGRCFKKLLNLVKSELS